MTREVSVVRQLTPEEVELAMGHTFADRRMLLGACNRKSPEFAALEFIGDAYLNLSVSLACWHAGLRPEDAIARFRNKNLRTRFTALFGPRGLEEREDYLETSIGAMSFEAGFGDLVRASLSLVGGDLPMPPVVDRPADRLHESPEFRNARWLGESVLKCVAVDILRRRHGIDGLVAEELHGELLRMQGNLSERLANGRVRRWPRTAPPERRRLARSAAATLVEHGWETTRVLLSREFMPDGH